MPTEKTYRTAEQLKDGSVRFTDEEGVVEIRKKGTGENASTFLGRLNNVGNLKYLPRGVGVIGSYKVTYKDKDGNLVTSRFGIYESVETGWQAYQRSMEAKMKKDRTVGEVLEIYAPKKENDTSKYKNDFEKGTGISRDEMYNEVMGDPDRRYKMYMRILELEGSVKKNPDKEGSYQYKTGVVDGEKPTTKEFNVSKPRSIAPVAKPSAEPPVERPKMVPKSGTDGGLQYMRHLPGPPLSREDQAVANMASDAEIEEMLAGGGYLDPDHADHEARRRLMRGLGGRPDLDFARTVAAGKAKSTQSWARGRRSSGGPVHVDAYTRDGPNGPISVASHSRSAPARARA